MGSIGKYSGESLATMEKIMGNITSYYPNKVYKNAEHNIYWFINSKGYMHVLIPAKLMDGERIFCYAIEEYLLTNKNTLRSIGYSGNYKTSHEVIEELERMIDESV